MLEESGHFYLILFVYPLAFSLAAPPSEYCEGIAMAQLDHVTMVLISLRFCPLDSGQLCLLFE